MKKNKLTKIVAFIALFGIFIGIIGTGILIIFGGENTTTTNSKGITEKEFSELIKSKTGVTINNGSGNIETSSGNNISKENK